MTDDQDILFERAGGVARITLNRPGKLNALTVPMVEALRAALAEAEADPDVRAVLLRGAGRAFGAGFDLAGAQDAGAQASGAQDSGAQDSGAQGGEPPALGRVLDRHFNPLVRALRRSRLPVVAAVQGACAGGSVGVALACDLVLAGRSAFFYEPFVGIALVPDVGNSLFLPRLAGRIRAAGMAFLGERIAAEEARAWGLVWKVVEDDALAAESEAVAARLAEQPAEALAATKRLLAAAAEPDLDAQLDLERDLQDAAGRSEASRAAIAAFLSRRR